MIQIRERDQKLFYSSRPGVEIPSQPVTGYHYVATPQGRWRVYGLRDHDVLVQTAQSLSALEELAATMAFRVVWPLLVILPLLGALACLPVPRGPRASPLATWMMRRPEIGALLRQTP